MQVPAYVEYEKATSVEHALALLARFGPEARILAGGHSLIPMMKLRLAQLGNRRRLALPGGPVRGPVRGVRGAEGDHDHPGSGRDQDGAGQGVPYRALRDGGGRRRAARSE